MTKKEGWLSYFISIVTPKTLFYVRTHIVHLQEGLGMEKDQNLKRPILAIMLTPIMLASFVWLEEIAKGTDIHYFGQGEELILNDFFVEIMFGAFIPLAIGTGLLLFSRIEEAPRLLKYSLYAIAILCLIPTIFVAHSLATVPRGGKQTSFYISPDTFIGNITRYDTGEYRGVAYQTVFTQNYTTTWVTVTNFGTSDDPGYLDVSLQTTKPVNMSGNLHFDVILYRAADEYRQDQPFNLAPSMHVSIDLQGTRWNGKIHVPTLDWGSYSEYERMRLEGYKIGFLLWLELRGTDPGEVVEFTADVTDSFRVADFRVDSSLQNGVAILLCGVFIGIYILILGKPLVSSVRHAASETSMKVLREKNPSQISVDFM
jgi:hypothetical protein